MKLNIIKNIDWLQSWIYNIISQWDDYIVINNGIRDILLHWIFYLQNKKYFNFIK